MKNRYMQHIIFLFAIAGTTLIFSCKSSMKQDREMQELLILKSVIEKQIQNEARQISDQLSAFSKVIASDRDFAMKLLVENNRSAPEVTDIAQRFMDPMGFSLLEIADSGRTLLSCAQFPANTGISIAEKAGALGEQALFIVDNVKGQKTLTLQKQLRFSILDVPFYCLGGRIVDEAFIARLSPGNGFRLAFKQGDSLLGMNNAGSISDIKDSTVMIDNRLCPATRIALPFAGKGDAPAVILIKEKALERP